MKKDQRPLTRALAALTVATMLLASATDASAAPDRPADSPAKHAVPAWNAGSAKVDAKVAAINRIRRSVERQPDHFAGVSTSGPDDVTINLVAGTALSADLAAMDRDAGAYGITLKRRYQKHSLRELTRLEAAISNDQKRSPAVRFARVAVNPDTNTVEIGVHELDAVAGELRSTYGDRVSVVVVEPLQLAYGRFNDVQPFFAGNRIGIGERGSCTSGFTITNLYGYRFALTAGHCTPEIGNPPVRLFRADNVSSYDELGRVDYRRYGGGNLDNALIGVNRYGGRMWSSPNLFDDSTTFLPVHGATDSCDGCQVYVNGSFTGLGLGTLQGAPGCETISGAYSCGLQRVVSTNGNRICQGGDSGGPVFAHDGRGGVVAVGIIQAVNGTGTLCIYTRIVPVLAYWRSTITT